MGWDGSGFNGMMVLGVWWGLCLKSTSVNDKGCVRSFSLILKDFNIEGKLSQVN